jgi:hypothetical protein
VQRGIVPGRSTRSLEGIEAVASDAPSKIVGLGLLVLGISIIGLGLFMFLPVAVNLPESWFGAVLALALLGIGGALVYAAGRNFRKAESK